MQTRENYIAVGMGLGTVFGIVLGLLIFPDNFALGIPLGVSVGFGFAMLLAQGIDND